jgi:hypothetical protein
MHVVEFFASFTKLPIRLDDIAEQVKESAGIDSIRFIPVEIDRSVLMGMHRKYRETLSDGSHRIVVDIIYAAAIAVDPPLLRMVCCKELIHAADDPKVAAQSMEAVDRLIEFIVVPPASGISAAALSDHNGILYTLMVLLPRDALFELRPKFQAGQISVEDVARLADIPENYARLALSPIWETVVEALK